MPNTNSFDVRARVPAELWPTDEQIPGTTREKLIVILQEYEVYRQLKRELLTVDLNPFIAVGKATQAYRSSAQPAALYAAVPYQQPLVTPLVYEPTTGTTEAAEGTPDGMLPTVAPEGTGQEDW